MTKISRLTFIPFFRTGVFSLIVAIFAAMFVGGMFVTAQETKPLTPLQMPPTTLATPVDMYKVPDGLNPDELLDYLRTFMAKRPTDRSKVAEVFGTVADRIMAANPAEAMELQAKELKLVSLLIKSSENVAEKPKLEAYIAELEKNPKFTELANEGKMMLATQRYMELFQNPDLTLEQYDTFRKEETEKFKGKWDESNLQLMMMLVEGTEMIAEKFEKPDRSISLYKEIRDLVVAQKQERYAPLVDELDTKIRQAELVGNEFKLESVTLDGKKFDWKTFRKNKVVLIDFWATWCQPCLMELPNVKAMYEKYKDKGFEVLSISVDEDLDSLKKFLEIEKTTWTVLSTTLAEEQKIVSPMDYYGFQGIPTMILVGRDGNVVSLRARGEILRKLLEKEFPETPEKK